MLKIKVCGMRDPDNIREISALKPDFLGFIFYPRSIRYFGTNYDTITSIPNEISKVGVFVNEEPEKIMDVAAKCRLNLIQLHGSESPGDCSRLKDAGFHVIKSFGIDESFDFSALEDYNSSCEFFLFDAKTNSFGGSGKKFNRDLIGLYKLRKPFFFSGGIGPDDREYFRKLRHDGFFAVDINSRFETSPGIKDPLITSNFIHEVRRTSNQYLSE